MDIGVSYPQTLSGPTRKILEMFLEYRTHPVHQCVYRQGLPSQ